MVDDIKYCKTWTIFEVKERDGSILKLRIEDLPLDRTDDAVEFLVNHYMKEEAFQVAAGTYAMCFCVLINWIMNFRLMPNY